MANKSGCKGDDERVSELEEAIDPMSLSCRGGALSIKNNASPEALSLYMTEQTETGRGYRLKATE